MDGVAGTLEQSAPIRAPSRPARTTGQLAALVVDTNYGSLSPSVVHAAKRVILDTIAVTIGAFDTPMARSLLKLKRDQGGRAEATLMVEGTRIPAASAAYIHAQLANLLDADETLLNRTHTLSASVMSGLALAERTGASGQELIAAITSGFEITNRVGLSLRQYMSDGKGGTVFAPLFGFSWMAFGAAATSGKLLGLDQAGLARALGQAFVTAPIIYDIPRQNRPFYQLGWPANWHRYQMPGVAAEAGINAALLASDGWVAQSDVLDEGSEFWRSFGALGCDWDIMYANRGPRWYIAETSIKPYPFCRYGHVAIDLFAEILSENGLVADEIEDVLVRVAPLRQLEELAENTEIDEPLKLMVSLPMALALVASGVPAGPLWFAADMTDQRLRAFAHRVRSEANPAWGPILTGQLQGGSVFRRTPTEVIVRARSSEYRKSAENARGDPWAPGFEMSDAQLLAKVHRFTDQCLGSDRSDRLIDAVFSMDTAQDVGAIVAAMHL